MSTISQLLASITPRAKRLKRLAQIAAESERLASALAHHAETCEYTGIADQVRTAAAAEKADSAALRSLCSDHHVRPLIGNDSNSHGANNWERISADLAAELELVRALNAAIAEWEGTDAQTAEALRALFDRKEQTLTLLRDAALKCDPQAFD